MKREALIAATIAMLSGTALAASEGSGEQSESQSQKQSGSQQGQEGQSQKQSGNQQGQEGQSQTQSGNQQGQEGQSQTQSGNQQGQEGQSQTQTTGSSEQQNQGSGDAQGQQSGSGGPVIRTQSQGQIRAQELMEASITTPEQEEVGSINDLILDQDGRLVGVIVGVGGYLGMGEKNVALSWDQVDYNRQEQTATVKVSKKELDEAPAFKDAQSQQQE